MKILGLALAAATLAAAPAAAAGKSVFTVRNDSRGGLACSVKADGSSRTENLFIKPGATWTRSYPGGKARRFRCEGSFSSWQRISAGTAYSAVQASDGRVVLRAPAGRD